MPPLGEPPFDLITCRNVLIYFDPPTVERVAGALARAARRGGRLILGAADRISGPIGAALSPAPKPRRRPAPAAAPTPRPAPARREPARLADALAAANDGRLEAAVALIGELLARDPLNADAYFVRALAELGGGDAVAAVESLRRALYIDPQFGLAAFKLGRAHEARGELQAAAQAYERALRTLDGAEARPIELGEEIDLADIAAVCRLRLRALARPARALGARP
jgi:tetratricopeptide (TPR) repeat protein